MPNKIPPTQTNDILINRNEEDQQSQIYEV